MCKKRIATQTEKPISFCTSHRELRAQQFDPTTGFLPHFRGVSFVSSYEFTGEEYVMEAIMTKHLDFYLGGIKRLINGGLYQCKQLKVAFSSIRILNALMKRYDMDAGTIRKNTQNTDFNLFDEYHISIPTEISVFDSIDPECCCNIWSWKNDRNTTKNFKKYLFSFAKTIPRSGVCFRFK